MGKVYFVRHHPQFTQLGVHQALPAVAVAWCNLGGHRHIHRVGVTHDLYDNYYVACSYLYSSIILWDLLVPPSNLFVETHRAQGVTRPLSRTALTQRVASATSFTCGPPGDMQLYHRWHIMLRGGRRPVRRGS